MSVAFIRPTVIGRRHNFVIQRLWLKSSALAGWAGRVRAITTEQHPHVHFVSFAFEPSEKTADAVPAILLVIFVGVIAALLPVDHEILIGFRQFLEWNMNVDLLAGTGAEQIFLRLAKFDAAKNAHHPLQDSEPAIRNRFVQVNRNGTAKAAAFRTRAERIVEAEKPRRGRTNVDVAMRAMPTGGERHFRLRIADGGLRRSWGLGMRRWAFGVFFDRNDIDSVLAESQCGLERLHQTRPILGTDRDAVLNDLHARAESFDLRAGIDTHDLVIDPDAQVALLLQKIEELARRGFYRNGNPECDEHILAGELAQDFIGNRFGCFRMNFAAAAWTKGAGDAREKQLQIIADLSNGADG